MCRTTRGAGWDSPASAGAHSILARIRISFKMLCQDQGVMALVLFTWLSLKCQSDCNDA